MNVTKEKHACNHILSRNGVMFTLSLHQLGNRKTMPTLSYWQTTTLSVSNSSEGSASLTSSSEFKGSCNPTKRMIGDTLLTWPSLPRIYMSIRFEFSTVGNETKLETSSSPCSSSLSSSLFSSSSSTSSSLSSSSSSSDDVSLAPSVCTKGLAAG